MLVMVTSPITADKIKSYNIPDVEEGLSAYDIDRVYLAGERCVDNNHIYQAVVGDAIEGLSAWAGDTTFAAGQKCYVAATHRIYQSRTPTTDQYPPNYLDDIWTAIGWVNQGADLADTTYWADLGSTNYWGQFDDFTSTQTVGLPVDDGYAIDVSLDSNKCNAAALFNCYGKRIDFSVVDAEGVVLWSDSVNLVERNSRTYSDFFFNRNLRIRSDLIVRFPAYFNTTLRIYIWGPTAAKCGMIKEGYLKEIATTQNNVSLSINDYSEVTTSAFGVTTITKRQNKKRNSIPLRIKTKDVDMVYRFFSQLSSVPCVYICDKDGSLQCMTIHGLFENFKIVIPGDTVSDVSVDINGIN